MAVDKCLRAHSSSNLPLLLWVFFCIYSWCRLSLCLISSTTTTTTIILYMSADVNSCVIGEWLPWEAPHLLDHLGLELVGHSCDVPALDDSHLGAFPCIRHYELVPSLVSCPVRSRIIKPPRISAPCLSLRHSRMSSDKDSSNSSCHLPVRLVAIQTTTKTHEPRRDT